MSTKLVHSTTFVSAKAVLVFDLYIINIGLNPLPLLPGELQGFLQREQAPPKLGNINRNLKEEGRRYSEG